MVFPKDFFFFFFAEDIHSPYTLKPPKHTGIRVHSFKCFNEPRALEVHCNLLKASSIVAVSLILNLQTTCLARWSSIQGVSKPQYIGTSYFQDLCTKSFAKRTRTFSLFENHFFKFNIWFYRKGRTIHYDYLSQWLTLCRFIMNKWG